MKSTGKVILLVGLTLAVALWFYEARSFSTFQADTESLALNAVKAVEENLIDVDPRFALKIYDTRDGATYAEPYTSQIGLQGIFYRLLIPIVGVGNHNAYPFLCAVATAGVLCLIAWQMSKRYGLLQGAVFLFVSVANPWLTLFASNMYWATATMFFPLLLSLLYLNIADRPHSKQLHIIIYIGYFSAILIKCLCGYEYISTIMLMGICLPAAEWIAQPSRKKFFRILIIGVCSLLGFIVAYGIHSFVMGNGDLLEGARQIFENVVLRRVGNDAADFTGVIAESKEVPAIETVLLYFTARPTGYIASGLLIAVPACLCYKALVWKEDVKLESSAFFIAFLAPISWFVLAKPHSYLHTHMNFVLWYLGGIQIAMWLCAKFFLEMHQRTKQI